MCCIGNIGSGALLQEFDLSQDCSVVEVLVKRRSGSVAPKNLVGHGCCLSWCSVLGELDVIDNYINYMRLR